MGWPVHATARHIGGFRAAFLTAAALVAVLGLAAPLQARGNTPSDRDTRAGN